MKRNLIKASIMMLTLMIVLTFGFTARAQEISNGNAPMSNRSVTSNYNSACQAADSWRTFFNDRTSQCGVFPTFTNGDDRILFASDNQYYTYGPQAYRAYGLTSCGCATGGITITRDFQNYEDSLQAWIGHRVTVMPRNANCSLNVAAAFIASQEVLCMFNKQSGEGDDEIEDTCPIAIDLNNDGVVRLTNRAEGTRFDLDRNGTKEQLPWLADDADGWLVFDMFGNGHIADGFQLFGPGSLNNGYLHLRGWDDNKDNVIDARDGIWTSLAVWIDRNRNGVSEPGDLVYLPYSGLESISLDFKESRRKDKHGNEFRYRSKVKFINGQEGYSFDVFLLAR